MNDDAYAEWLVKRKDPIYAVPVKILMAVLCLVSLLIAMQTAFGAILLIAVGIAAYFVFINLSVEFEYLVVHLRTQWVQDLRADLSAGRRLREDSV